MYNGKLLYRISRRDFKSDGESRILHVFQTKLYDTRVLDLVRKTVDITKKSDRFIICAELVPKITLKGNKKTELQASVEVRDWGGMKFTNNSRADSPRDSYFGVLSLPCYTELEYEASDIHVLKIQPDMYKYSDIVNHRALGDMPLEIMRVFGRFLERGLHTRIGVHREVDDCDCESYTLMELGREL